MNLTVLGSGTSVPHPQRSSPGFWLETNSGTVLLDIGPDVPHRMAEERLDWPNLDAIWLSHFHLDHFGGVAPFLFSLRWAPQVKRRKKTLKIFGPKGTTSLLNTISDANNYRLFTQGFPIELVEVSADEQFQVLPELDAQTMKTPHTNESLALHLKESDGKRLVYTSDTGFTREINTFAKNVELLLVECSFRRNKPLQTHLELSETMDLAQHSAPTRLMLTHLYPEWDDFNVVAEAELFWQGEVIEATDSLVIPI